jgi:hypothetical protein
VLSRSVVTGLTVCIALLRLDIQNVLRVDERVGQSLVLVLDFVILRVQFALLGIEFCPFLLERVYARQLALEALRVEVSFRRLMERDVGAFVLIKVFVPTAPFVAVIGGSRFAVVPRLASN